MSASDGLVGGGERRRVFVYGTLRRGGSNEHRMAGGRFIAPATVRGRLYHIDWYPGLVLDPQGDVVTGEIHEVDAALFAALDVYEGSEYRKSTTTSEGVAGEPVILWEWDGPVDESRRILAGDWLEQDRPTAGR